MAARTRCSILATVLIVSAGAAQSDVRLVLSVSAPESDGHNVPLHATVSLPQSLANELDEYIAVTLQEEGVPGSGVPGQIVRKDGAAELWWIAPQLKAGRAGNWVATLRVTDARVRPCFISRERAEQYLDLCWDNRPVLRYMYACDASSQERLHQTYKPYYHVFDAAGEKLLTKGPGGLYTHHRGIFIGWNKLKHGGEEYDFWHMKDVTQQHQRTLYLNAGPVLARLKSLIHWNDPAGKPVIAEEREASVFRQAAPTILLLEFRATLKAVAGDVFLDGDPEHAGVQYRAHNDVAAADQALKASYLFHEDGIDPHQDKDLPWVAMSYGLNGRRYVVQHMNHPENPKPSIYSAYRDYGRFGVFFKHRIDAGQSLSLRYRIWVVEGEPPARQEMAARHTAFTSPPKVEVLNVAQTP
ncbi:MAG TPA: DUF6807 family protein [Phycisphaerae bacterium]|nr:DUF6807 family protein [Phycisphaerae bacterium]